MTARGSWERALDEQRAKLEADRAETEAAAERVAHLLGSLVAPPYRAKEWDDYSPRMRAWLLDLARRIVATVRGE